MSNLRQGIGGSLIRYMKLTHFLLHICERIA